jgi:DNA-binding NarL/FixJ family response regulator
VTVQEEAAFYLRRAIAELTDLEPERRASLRAALQALTARTVDPPPPSRRRAYGDQLSPREREVVRLVAAGHSNKTIGELLTLSVRTVDRHLESARRKLAVHSRTALVLKAIEQGLEL